MYCGKAARVAVVLDFVLGPAEMAPAVLQCPGGSNGAGWPRTPWSECGCARQKVRGTRGGPELLKGGVWDSVRVI